MPIRCTAEAYAQAAARNRASPVSAGRPATAETSERTSDMTDTDSSRRDRRMPEEAAARFASAFSPALDKPIPPTSPFAARAPFAASALEGVERMPEAVPDTLANDDAFMRALGSLESQERELGRQSALLRRHSNSFERHAHELGEQSAELKRQSAAFDAFVEGSERDARRSRRIAWASLAVAAASMLVAAASLASQLGMLRL